MATSKKFTFLQLLNLVDGRLFTTMDDIEEMLCQYSGEERIYTVGLTFVYAKLKSENPKWFADLKERWEQIKNERGWQDVPQEKFLGMCAVIKASYNQEFEIPAPQSKK